MYNICIVGYGAIGPVHAVALKGLSNIKLEAICDINHERADKGAYDNNCRAIYNFDDVINDSSIDSVHICTPHYLHYEMIVKSIEAGKVVVVEKPIAMKKEEFEIILDKYPNAPIYPILQNRTNAAVCHMRQIIEEDEDLGEFMGARAFLTWCRDEAYYNQDEWRGTTEYEGGGVLINQAVHTLDLLGYFCGGFSDVKATMTNKSLEGIIEVEDTVDAVLTTQNGKKALFYASNGFSTDIHPQIDIIFKNKSFHYMNNSLYCENKLVSTNCTEFLGKSCYGVGHKNVFESVYCGIGKCLSVDDVKNTMYTMYAIYESAKQNGRMITI